MKKIILIMLLIQFGCVSKPRIHQSDSNVIPSSWLTKKASVNEIHEGNFRFCSAIESITFPIEDHPKMKEGEVYSIDDFELKESKCVKESGNLFEHNLDEDYKVYEYSGREGRRLEKGYALIIENIIVDTIKIVVLANPLGTSDDTTSSYKSNSLSSNTAS